PTPPPFTDERVEFEVRRLDYKVDTESNISEWVESTDSIKIRVVETAAAAGKTKEMFMIEMDGKHYAGKSFFTLNSESVTEPSHEENLRYLKAEVAVQHMTSQTVARFNTAATDSCVAIAPVKVAIPFILMVTEGPEAERAWLCDPLLSKTQTIKYSGMDTAGHHQEIYGSTCDAIAHFSLADSSEYMVLVDIQGTTRYQCLSR
ncbi:unnamed protein product, partial [Mycena citricolor]